MTRTAARRGGARLNRSETVTIRLDPKLNYLCELAARSQRRTKSSMIEAALVDALTVVPVDHRAAAEDKISISDLAEGLWHVDEVERLRRLALFAPHLMTYDEQKIWATLGKSAWFWQGTWEPFGEDKAVFRPNLHPDNLLVVRAEEQLEEVKAVAAGEKDAAVLPQALQYLPWHDQMVDATMAPALITEAAGKTQNDG